MTLLKMTAVGEGQRKKAAAALRLAAMLRSGQLTGDQLAEMTRKMAQHDEVERLAGAMRRPDGSLPGYVADLRRRNRVSLFVDAAAEASALVQAERAIAGAMALSRGEAPQPAGPRPLPGGIISHLISGNPDWHRRHMLGPQRHMFDLAGSGDAVPAPPKPPSRPRRRRRR